MTTTITDEMLAKLDVLLREATPGPWLACQLDGGEDKTVAAKYVSGCIEIGSGPFYIVLATKPGGDVDVCHSGNGPTSLWNARFMEAAREALPLLVAEVRRLRSSPLLVSEGAARASIPDRVAVRIQWLLDAAFEDDGKQKWGPRTISARENLEAEIEAAIDDAYEAAPAPAPRADADARRAALEEAARHVLAQVGTFQGPSGPVKMVDSALRLVADGIRARAPSPSPSPLATPKEK